MFIYTAPSGSSGAPVPLRSGKSIESAVRRKFCHGTGRPRPRQRAYTLPAPSRSSFPLPWRRQRHGGVGCDGRCRASATSSLPPSLCHPLHPDPRNPDLVLAVAERVKRDRSNRARSRIGFDQHFVRRSWDRWWARLAPIRRHHRRHHQQQQRYRCWVPASPLATAHHLSKRVADGIFYRDPLNGSP